MSELEAHDPRVLRSYEGLVFTTASLLFADLRGRGILTAEDDLDDIMQLLRVKVFRALRSFNPLKARRKTGESIVQARDRYVFMCLRDMAKDIAKRKRTRVLMIEDQATTTLTIEADGATPRDSFDARYLAQSHDETYRMVEEALPLIPNTLSQLERSVLVLLYRDYTHREIAARLGTTKGEVSSAVRAIRSKLADWRPDGAGPEIPVSQDETAIAT